jgi:N-methylhydantoinase A/oxoprolinase/acetone carboxylase beta subunit
MAFIFKKKKEKDISEYLSEIERLKEKIDELSQEIEKLKEKEKVSFKKVGLVRFNPFQDLGGNQSFSLALLNEVDDGFVVTSLFGREGNRVYAKPIEKGNSIYPLTEEEKKAIKMAKHGKNNNSKTTGRGNSGTH